MINIRNFNLQEGENGILLVFPKVPESLPNKDLYIIEFKVSSALPTISPPTVTFIPENPNYVINKSKNFEPTVNLKIKAAHNFETQVLIQAIVKDQFNNVLYNDYLIVICSPTAEFSFKGTILDWTTPQGVGPNLGIVLRLQEASALDSLLVGMRVEGYEIPEDKVITIRSFMDGRPQDIELSEPPGGIPIIFRADRVGAYTFTRSLICAKPEQLVVKQNQGAYVILNKNNNWTYKYDEQIVAQFIRENFMDDDIEIILPLKNVSVLVERDSAARVPSTTDIYGIGRVINNSVCLHTIS